MPFFYVIAIAASVVALPVLAYSLFMEATERKKPEAWPGEREWQRKRDADTSRRFATGLSTYAPKGRM